MSALVELLGKELIDGKCQKLDTKSVVEAKKVIGVYFSAHWCPPCRKFTPVLAEFYSKLKDEKSFEIIFVSSDQDKEQWEEYFREMPWLAIPYEDRRLKERLCQSFNVSGIPTFVLLDAATGDVITTGAREMVTKDQLGKNFPWAN